MRGATCSSRCGGGGGPAPCGQRDHALWNSEWGRLRAKGRGGGVRERGQGAGRFDAGKDAGEGLRESQKGFRLQCSGLEWQEPNPNSFRRQRNLLTHESEKAWAEFPPGAAGPRVRGCPRLSMPLQLFISSLCQAGSTRPTGGSLAAAAPVPRAQV